MKENKLPGRLLSIFRVMVDIILVGILLSALIATTLFYTKGLSLPELNFSYSLGSLLILGSLYYIFNRLVKTGKITKIKNGYYFLAVFLLMLISAYIFKHPPSWDVNATISAVADYTKFHSLPAYLYIYPNNIPYFTILLVLSKLFSVTNPHYWTLINVFNATTIVLAVIIFTLAIDKIDRAWARLFIIFSSLFIPLYLYSAIPYSDTFSLLPLALFSYFVVPKKKSKLLLVNFLLAIIFLTISVIIKQSLIIVLLALVLSLALSEGSGVKIKERTMGIIMPVTTYALLALLVYNGLVVAIYRPNKELLDNGSFPTYQWLYMGENDAKVGGYNKADVDYTLSLISAGNSRVTVSETLKNAAIKRIRDRGISGNISYFSTKFAKIWGQPDFFAFSEGSDSFFSNGLLPHKFLDGNIYYCMYIFMAGFFEFIIFTTLVGTVNNLKTYRLTVNSEPLLIYISKMSLIGVTIFLMLWETRSRYLLIFIPLLILIAAHYASRASEIKTNSS